MKGEPVKDILKRYEGQEVFVVVEVLASDSKTYEPITGRLIGVTPDEDEASRMCQGVKHVMVRWVGKLEEVIILHASLPLRPTKAAH